MLRTGRGRAALNVTSKARRISVRPPGAPVDPEAAPPGADGTGTAGAVGTEAGTAPVGAPLSAPPACTRAAESERPGKAPSSCTPPRDRLLGSEARATRDVPWTANW